jgi:hypothetical protein
MPDSRVASPTSQQTDDAPPLPPTAAIAELLPAPAWNRACLRLTFVWLTVVAISLLLHAALMISNNYIDPQHVLMRIGSRFYMGGEWTVPTWISSCMLYTAALLLIAIALVNRERHQTRTWPWSSLAVIFLFVSADELLSFHEYLAPLVKNVLDTDGILHMAWIIPGAIFVLLLGLIYHRWLFRLPKPTRRLCLFAALFYVGGALGFETLSGYAISEEGAWLPQKQAYILLMTLEETFEMLGIVVFMHALTTYLGALLHHSQSAPSASSPSRHTLTTT